MTISNSNDSLRSPKMHAILGTGRRHLSGWRGIFLLAGPALALGLAFKWNWLVAAGITPFVVSLLPCAAMCTLGFCLHKATGSTAQPKLPSADAEPDADRKN